MHDTKPLTNNLTLKSELFTYGGVFTGKMILKCSVYLELVFLEWSSDQCCSGNWTGGLSYGGFFAENATCCWRQGLRVGLHAIE